MKSFRLLAIAASCFGSSLWPVLVFSQERIDEISRQGHQAVSVTVDAADPQLMRLARRGFAMHGGFELVTAQDAAWVARFEKTATGINYRVEAKGGDAVIAQGSVHGQVLEAMLAALDGIVLQVTKRPGFFQGRLVFVAEPSGNTELYTSDILFEAVTPLSNFGAQVVSPRWSPDGRYLVFTSYAATGYPDIVRLDIGEGMLNTIANYRGVNLGARFSPDGNRLAFVSSSSGTPEIYISRPDGSQAQRFTWTKGLAATPTWSPDGSQLIFTSDDWGGPQIILLDLAQKRNTRIRTGMGGYNAEAAWNPLDRDQIAFTAQRNGQFQIALYQFSTGKSVQLTSQIGDSVEPVWLSDGRHLIVTYREGATKRLRILDSETGKTNDPHTLQLVGACQADFVGKF
ncbi:MAG: hypothetical protein MK080_11135 [Opitutales bacterium]|nr:hypothetical protein [Opitutales bacterium]NRA27317.1 PD40 domain-containing protein [Opitutales bacterium]